MWYGLLASSGRANSRKFLYCGVTSNHVEAPMTAEIIHPSARQSSCACCGDMLRGAFSRRHFVLGAAAFGAAATLSPYMALAAEGNYEAMVLGCIDPRLQEPMHRYTVRHGLTGK